MATANIAYFRGTGAGATWDGTVGRSPLPMLGPLLYSEAGAQLASNVEVTTAAKIAIPAEALAVGALIEISMVSGGIYVTTGVEADDNIAVGGGRHRGEGQALQLEIGRTPAGVQHTHLLVIAAA